MIELFQKDFKGSNIPQARSTGGFVIFKADWCGHCRRTLPELEKVSKMTGSAFPIYKVDSDKNKELMRRIGITGFPTMYWIDQSGNLSDQYNGERTQKEFLKAICEKARHCY